MGNRRTTVAQLLALGVAGLSLCQTAAASQQASYPKQVITFIVPYAAGGSSDTRSRQLAQLMGQELGVTVVVDNKPGASGNIGTTAIAKAKPDGYTIGLGNFAPLSVNAHLYGSTMQFNPQKDLAPVALIERGAVVMAAKTNGSIKSAKDLIAGKATHALSYGSTGAGSASHLSTELFKQLAKVEAVHVPYRGGAPALNDLMAGNIDFYMELPSLFLGYVGGDKPRITPLAVAGPTRLKSLPDTPTFEELGVKGMVAFNWFGVVAPAGTPKDIIDRLNVAVNKALKDSNYRSVVESQGAEVAGGTPQEFKQFIDAESQKWSQLIKDRGIQLN